MKKTITGSHRAEPGGRSDQGWLNLAQIASVEVTSEDPAFPIEAALEPAEGRGWRASESGEQKIRVSFEQPARLKSIQLRFHEAEFERTQEFVLRWWAAEGGAPREIVRQQWNFSPAASTTELEEYTVDLRDVAGVELVIQPDIGGRPVVATLAAMRFR